MGLVLATGNFGNKLSGNELEKYLVVSRDGGLRWKVAKKGDWIYEIGDHGAIIVASPREEPTTDIQFSLDEGITWSRFKVSEEPILI